MEARDCLHMLREIRDVVFSTVDEAGLPQARMIDIMLADDGAVYFLTARGKDFYRQLERDGHVAVTGMNKEWQTVRLTGVATRLDDQKAWIDRMFDENPGMNNVYPGESRYILEPFSISAGELDFFDLGHEPIDRAHFSFGGTVAHESGFVITDGCIGCGTCAAGCPQQCIEEGDPYVIDPVHCLHCGLCYENCPVQAIQRLGE